MFSTLPTNPEAPIESKLLELAVNGSKSENICIRTPARRNAFARKCSNLVIDMANGNGIYCKECVKYLGVTTDSVKFFKHTLAMIRKGNYGLHLVQLLLRKKNGLNKATKFLVYKQLIRPVITYASPIWLPNAMSRITKLERKVLRIFSTNNRILVLINEFFLDIFL